MATVAAAVMNGAHIVRVHNVKQAVETVRVIDAIKRGKIEGAYNGQDKARAASCCALILATRHVQGVAEQSRIVDHWRIRTERDITADEMGILIQNLFKNSDLQMKEIKHMIVSCVVPPLLNRSNLRVGTFI